LFVILDIIKKKKKKKKKSFELLKQWIDKMSSGYRIAQLIICNSSKDEAKMGKIY